MAYHLLKGKKGIIFGALNDQSIAWEVAKKAYEEGATFVLSNAPSALRFGDTQKMADQCGTIIIPADVTKLENIENVFTGTLEHFGGKIDFIMHSIGMSPNVRKKRLYSDLDYNYVYQTLDISALSLHKILQTAFRMDAVNEWGSVVALTYVAAQRPL